MSFEDEEGDHVREVYARYGLALYGAQVLEHGIVNALVVIALIPSRRQQTPSAEEWGLAVDEFMSRHFERTMGRLVRDLQSVTSVPPELEELLREALRKRNWLAHEFFRERAEEFMSVSGRETMLAELDECCAIFQLADERLGEVVRPLRVAAGLTDELLATIFEEMKAKAERPG